MPHHPLYYIDFADLRKVIDRNDNWTTLFQPLFGEKDVICGPLRRLETIRNAVAHNRVVSPADAATIEDLAHLLQITLGETTLERLVRNRTTACDIETRLAELKIEATRLCQLCIECTPLPSLVLWTDIDNSWWFDSDYLGHPVEEIRLFFALLYEYEQLPRYRGAGHVIEAWVRGKQLPQALCGAEAALERMLTRG